MGTWELSAGRPQSLLEVVVLLPASALSRSLDLPAWVLFSGGYRDAALAAVRRQAARWELPLTVVAYADLFGGWTMDAVARSTAGSGRSRACCTFCGVLRRRALEEGARLVGATHVVTGHNADDMAETVLMNFLRGDAGRLARGGGLGSPGEGRLAIGKGRRGLDEEGPPREPQPSRPPTSEPVPDF
ncbi:PREDICTED: cytoplasmic tRNA 2-thiolation protein 1 [Bison bison bison]|uniref:Cytoplasmic tRNA 2-thiolation protein 1 n=1 Tax=Bison bison bison TaxID=43346 RepID=A0A6P3HG98_BISBB|nr:PREDICTED: cytoplasmic tRNA 2-thiolation protein 1 [Bison bison bison]